MEQNEAGSRKYNVLIVGTGGQGAFADEPNGENSAKIISFAHAFKLHPGFTNPILYDTDPAKAEKAAKVWNTHKTDDYVFALGFQRFDVAIVATPDDTHYEILKTLAKHPLKLVICEKPLCTGLQEAQEIVELYKAKNTPLMVNNTRNYIPRLRSLVEAHGKATFGYCLFNKGWVHSAIHAIGFFNMLGLDNYLIKEVAQKETRTWVLVACFEDGYIWSEERVTDHMPVSDYYDQHMRYVVDNAYQFLEGNQPLLYDAKNALKDLEKCFVLMQNMI